MMKIILRIIALVISIALFVSAFSVLSKLLPYRDFRLQMAWDDIYGKRDIDCLFLGSSHVYTGINPDIVEEMTGLDTLVLSAGVQTMAETYYSLEEALKHQSPKYVFIDLYGLYKEFDQGDNFMNIDCMKLNLTKLKLAQAVFPDVPKIDIAFPLIREHSNWKEFKNIQNNYFMIKYPADNTKGYSGINTVMPEENAKHFENLEYDDTEITLRPEDTRYLHMINDLCYNLGVDLRFIMIPWYKGFADKINYRSLLDAISKEIDFTDYTVPAGDTLGLDYTHFIEEKPSDNQHLNIWGAEFFTKYLVETQAIKE